MITDWGRDYEKEETYPVPEPVLALMNRYDPDPAHARQVQNLAKRLFDTLIPLHSMGKEECRLLCYAALLHDIGWSVPDQPHHKASMHLILADMTLPVSTPDRTIIALIARYHRKTHPSSAHQLFGSLAAKQQHQVRWSAAILRVADALDRSHDSRVRSLSCEISDPEILIRCDTGGRPFPDPGMPFMKKKTLLLTEVSGKATRVIGG